jgi:flagellar motor switch protein FliN/FliY
MIESSPPLYWLRQVNEEIEENKKIPLLGTLPPFPWAQFSEKMQTLLETKQCQIGLTNSLSPEAENPSPSLFFRLNPLPGFVKWNLPRESIGEITAILLRGTPIQDPVFQEGFYSYMILQACKEIKDLNVYPDLQIEWISEEEIQDSLSLYFDISIQLENKQFTGKLALSSKLQQALASHFPKKSFDPSTSSIQPSIETCLSLEAGSCLLPLEQWKTVSCGDFLILDRCTYNPETQKGVLDLYFEEKPLFKVKLKKNSLKILDYAVYVGETKPMNDLPPENLMPEEMEEHTEESEEYIADSLVNKLESSPQGEILSSIKDVPLSITVEVGRLKMSLEKLLQLQPGNVLELAIKPEDGVNLTVQGKSIAKGELLKIGDVLGVKITQIGS